MTPDRTILLVDDNEFVLEVTSRMLEQLGFRVLTASSGFVAVDVFQTPPCRIDLVVMDLVMPGMDGEMLFDILKAGDPHLKALLITGYSADNKVSSILRKGCNGFIQKPFNLIQLSDKVHEILDAPIP